MKQSTIRFIHVFNDDKFIDAAIALFESVRPGQSDYYVLSAASTFTHIKSKNVTAISIKTKENAKNFVDQFAAESVFMLHALCPVKQLIVLELKPEMISTWFIWGYDLYKQWPFYKRNLYEQKTSRFINKSRRWQILKDQVKFNKVTESIFFSNNKKYIPFKNVINGWYESQFYQAAKKIDIVVPVVPTEFEFIKKMRLSPKQAPFNYSCSEWLSSGVELDSNAEDILVGNSADPSNNHLEIFEIISKLPLGNRKVYVPLSYGGNKKYIDFVVEKGNSILGENFYPLMDFMPLNKYNEFIAKCGFVFLYHKRQQALGNILSSIQMGAKIFFNRKSPVLTHFCSLGFNLGVTDLCTIDDLLPLGPEQLKNNLHLLQKHYSLIAVTAKVEEFVNIIEKIKSD